MENINNLNNLPQKSYNFNPSLAEHPDISALKKKVDLSSARFTLLYGPRCEKTSLRGFANNKGADQPEHMRSLISAFFVHLTESIRSRHSTRKISMF